MSMLRSHYEHAFLTSTVRPDCVRQVGQYLVQNGELFKKEKISFNPQSLNLLQCEVQTPELQSSSVDTQVCPPNPHSNIPDNTDSWNEVEDNETERAGIYDTIFTSPDFVEPEERASVYGNIDRGECDQVYSFAPAESSKPISIFLDKHSEELAFPNLFLGCARSEIHPVKIHYSDIVKSELRRSDRRVASCIDNIFYKLKRCQMQTITGKVNVAVRKKKTGGHVYTAGELRGPDSINKLVQFDNGYRILADVRSSPPYFERLQKELYAMIRQLGPANIFLTLSAAETRWTHLLRILSQVVDNT